MITIAGVTGAKEQLHDASRTVTTALSGNGWVGQETLKSGDDVLRDLANGVEVIAFIEAGASERLADGQEVEPLK